MNSIIRTDISLEERWEAAGRETLLTGTQALVRIPLMRRELDDAEGLDTAAYISGYRGSPLGGYDRELWKQKRRLAEHRIVFEPGLNEDLAATAAGARSSWGLPQGEAPGRLRHLVRQGAGGGSQRRCAAPCEWRGHGAAGQRSGPGGR